MKGRDTHINTLEMETMWKACQKCEEAMRGKTIFFQIDITTATAYLLKEGGTHCKTLNGLVKKFLLKYHRNGVMVCPEYLRGIMIISSLNYKI